MGSYCLIVLVLHDENSYGDWLQNNVHVLNTTEPYTKKGSDDMEFGMDMYTLLYLKWITNKALLHSMVPWWLSGKAYACNAGDTGSSPGLGRSPGERNGNPLQYSCLGNPMDRAAWWATVHGVAKRVRRDSVTKQRLDSTGNSAQS